MGHSGWRTGEGRRDGELLSVTGNSDRIQRENTARAAVAVAPSIIINNYCMQFVMVHFCMCTLWVWCDMYWFSLNNDYVQEVGWSWMKQAKYRLIRSIGTHNIMLKSLKTDPAAQWTM